MRIAEASHAIFFVALSQVLPGLYAGRDPLRRAPVIGPPRRRSGYAFPPSWVPYYGRPSSSGLSLYNMFGFSMEHKIFSNFTLLWLSQNMIVGSLDCNILNSLSRPLTHVTSFALSLIHLYFASLELREIVGYLEHLQVMGDEPSLNKKLLVNFLSSRSLAQSTSQNPTSLLSESPRLY